MLHRLHLFQFSRTTSQKETSDIFFLAISVYVFTLINDLLNWPILQFARVVSPIKYRDTSWVLQDADCYREIGSKIYGLQSEKECPGYLYGRPLLEVLNFLHVGESDLLPAVFMMRAFFAASLSILIIKISSNFVERFLFSALVLFSPGVQLMMYNSNVDLLIFAMVVIGFLLIQWKFPTLGLTLVFLSGLMKFYTIPLLLLFIFLIPKKRIKILSFLMFVIASVSAVSDLRLMEEKIPSSGYGQFGFTIFVKYLEEVGTEVSITSTYFVSSIIFLATTALVIWLTRHLKSTDTPKMVADKALFLVLTTVFISCFFTGLSYDPRLIYLTIAGFQLIIASQAGIHRKFLISLVSIASIFSSGLELGFIPGDHIGFHPLRILQFFNDVAIEFLSVVFFIWILQWFLRGAQRIPKL